MARIILQPTTAAATSDVFTVTNKTTTVRVVGQNFNGPDGANAQIEYLDSKGNWLKYSEGVASGLLYLGLNTSIITAPGIYRINKLATTSISGFEIVRH